MGVDSEERHTTCQCVRVIATVTLRFVSGDGTLPLPRERMPLDVLNGALVTRPIVGVNGRYTTSSFYAKRCRAG